MKSGLQSLKYFEQSCRRYPYFTVFAAALIYYTLYHFDVFLSLNSRLSSSIDDSLKNYYTYVYQVKNSTSLLHFSGFNYPYGEHIVYTDCQPLLTFLLRPLGFTHNYAIGILHFLIFLSFLLCPLVYLYLLRKLELPFWSSFAIALSITILSPQYFRIFAGHYALAYTCIIPISICLLMNFMEKANWKSAIWLSLFNSLMFLIHPYYGLGLSLFSAISLGFFWLFFSRGQWKLLIHLVISGVLPVLLFMTFMSLTDQHPGRSPEPFGNTDFISDVSSFLVPVYGPFNAILTQIVGHGPQHFEGCAYLGAGLIVVIVLSFLFLPFFIHRVGLNKVFLSLLFASFFFLLFSFGLQYKVQENFGIKIKALNQFRAMGRFSWFLYFLLPVAVFYFWHVFSKQKPGRLLLSLLSFFYLGMNMYEGHAYLKMYDGLMWKDRNVFNSQQLNAEEKNILSKIKTEKAAAILPLPTFYLGSEVYDRSSFTQQLFISAIYSYHSGLPIQSSCMSRTSVTETEAGIDLLNSYKRVKRSDPLLQNGPLLVIKCPEPLLLDEERVWSVSQQFAANDSVKFAFISQENLHQPILKTKPLVIQAHSHFRSDSGNLIYLQHENRRPYEESSQLAYEMVYILKADSIKPGSYVLSLHYYTEQQTYREMANMLVLARKKGEEYNWQNIFPLKLFSGFGDGYAILEQAVDLEKGYDYEIFIHGGDELTYKVSDFMLRPIDQDVMVIRMSGDTTYNNFPTR